MTDTAMADNSDDPTCTDCGGTGVTYQTERQCTCDAVIARHIPQSEAGLVERYLVEAENLDKIGENVSAIHSKMTGEETPDSGPLGAILREAATRIAQLEARLEVVPGWSQDADGITCRDDTIRLQDERIKRLEAQRERLAGALVTAMIPIEAILLSGADAAHHQDVRDALHDAQATARQALEKDASNVR